MIYFFWQENCAPCEEIKPLVKRVAGESGHTLLFMNVREHPELVERYRVKGTPTVVVEGKRMGRLAGRLINERSLKRLLNEG